MKLTRERLRDWLDRPAPRVDGWRTWVVDSPCVCSSGFVLAQVVGGYRMVPCSRCALSSEQVAEDG